VRRGIEHKENPPSEAAEPTLPPASDDRPGRDKTLGAFLQDYARIEPYISIGGRGRPRWAVERTAHLTSEQEALVDQWNEMFFAEIDALRRTRNIAVHDPETVSTETIEGARANTNELARILFGRLEHQR